MCSKDGRPPSLPLKCRGRPARAGRGTTRTGRRTSSRASPCARRARPAGASPVLCARVTSGREQRQGSGAAQTEGKGARSSTHVVEPVQPLLDEQPERAPLGGRRRATNAVAALKLKQEQHLVQPRELALLWSGGLRERTSATGEERWKEGRGRTGASLSSLRVASTHSRSTPSPTRTLSLPAHSPRRTPSASVRRSHTSRRSSNASDGSSTVSSATCGRAASEAYRALYSAWPWPLFDSAAASAPSPSAQARGRQDALLLEGREDEELREPQPRPVREVEERVERGEAGKVVGVVRRR